MGQPLELTPDELLQQQPRKSGCIIALALVGFACLCTCCVIPSMLYDAIFMRSVVLEQQGWRFEAKYELFFGISTKYSNLLFQGKNVGQSLPEPVNLVTPVGEFGQRGSEWSAVWSNPQIWDDDFRLPDVKKGEPWVTQIENALAVEELLAKGFYQAPKDVRSYAVPWTNQQLKGTPVHWVYVYRLSWTDPQYTEHSSHAVTGYWVDPAHLDDLSWE